MVQVRACLVSGGPPQNDLPKRMKSWWLPIITQEKLVQPKKDTPFAPLWALGPLGSSFMVTSTWRQERGGRPRFRGRGEGGKWATKGTPGLNHTLPLGLILKVPCFRGSPILRQRLATCGCGCGCEGWELDSQVSCHHDSSFKGRRGPLMELGVGQKSLFRDHWGKPLDKRSFPLSGKRYPWSFGSQEY